MKIIMQAGSGKRSGSRLVAICPPMNWKLSAEQGWQRILGQGVDVSSIMGFGMRLNLALTFMLSTHFTAAQPAHSPLRSRRDGLFPYVGFGLRTALLYSRIKKSKP